LNNRVLHTHHVFWVQTKRMVRLLAGIVNHALQGLENSQLDFGLCLFINSSGKESIKLVLPNKRNSSKGNVKDIPW